MTQAINIRPAGAEELAEVENLVKAAYREFQPLMPAAAWDRWMDNIRETLQGPEGVVLVAGDQGRLKGAVKFYPDAGQAHQGEWPAGAASIRLLAVAPASRGRGYGRLLTQACLDRARDLAIPTIFLFTGTFMTAARQLYEKLGFKRAPEFDRDPGPIAYRLDLGCKTILPRVKG
ncbi:MAG: GNAT family N-acetyltransferase [Deltaproteobacteria bacterium]|nr:GNAT family N-acetyltransferase [Deltaproteobacteria bacterium]